MEPLAAQRGSLGISRSKLYAGALDTFISTQPINDVTAAMDAPIDAAGAEADRFVAQGARRVLAHSES